MTPLAEGSELPLAQRYDVALYDLDGVLYVGPDAVPGAPEAVDAARRAGLRAAFVTNNASRTPAVVAAQLSELGITAEEGDVSTSAQAVARLLAEDLPAGSTVLVVGGQGLHEALAERGLRPVSSRRDNPAAVVQGFAPDVDWRSLAEAAYAARAGIPWYASNVDLTIPTPDGIAPGNGALVRAVAAAAGGWPRVAGKPETPLHDEAVMRSGARDPLVVGDRLDTDIEGAFNAGVPSLLVLTGVATPLEVVTAPPEHRPTYVAADLQAGLLRPHPPVATSDGAARCGGWAVRLREGSLDVEGEGDPVDGLRALAVAAWAAPEQLDESTALDAVHRVGW